jgi:hypothetical protein
MMSLILAVDWGKVKINARGFWEALAHLALFAYNGFVPW